MHPDDQEAGVRGVSSDGDREKKAEGKISGHTMRAVFDRYNVVSEPGFERCREPQGTLWAHSGVSGMTAAR
jgi:hypothetical protein